LSEIQAVGNRLILLPDHFAILFRLSCGVSFVLKFRFDQVPDFRGNDRLNRWRQILKAKAGTF
jgi:hypothetical protein